MTETRNHKNVGGFSWKFDGKMHFADLFDLDEFDEDYYKPVGLDEDERLFRYETDKAKIAGILPLIKINLKTERVYFLSERGSEIDMAHFETKGIKLKHLTLRDSKVFDK